jgi:hypothetical protein
MDVKLAIMIRNFAIGGVMFGALASLASGLFVEKSVSLQILLWPLFLSMPFIIFPPLMAKGCPNCQEAFFGRGFFMDINTSRCKSCGHIL